MQRTSSYSSHTRLCHPEPQKHWCTSAGCGRAHSSRNHSNKPSLSVQTLQPLRLLFQAMVSHQTNAELTKGAALTALKAEVPSQQQVRLGLQLSQLLYLHLHQDCPCSDAPGTTRADQRRGQDTVLKAAKAIAPHGFPSREAPVH